jgi:tripartite-type tricarboxylate transporter receptor subunit TctC
MRIPVRELAVAAAVCAVCTGVAHAAEDYPARPIRFVVPFPPGGSNDTIARMMGIYLGERLGKSIIIDNRAGAGGLVGIEIGAKAQPDGYTVLGISASFAFSSALRTKLPFDPVRSFAPVSKLATGPVVIAVYPGLPVKTIRELIAYAKARPGQLNFAGAGVGSAQHLAFELFRIMTKVDVVHVPFKGGAPAMIDVIAGNSQIAMGSVISLIPHIRAGKVRALATGGLKRSSALPDIPTIDESGVTGYDGSNWWGVMLPAGTPAAVVSRLDREIAAVVGLDEVKRRLSHDGAEPDYLSQDMFAKFVAAETAKWTRVVKAAGIQPQ